MLFVSNVLFAMYLVSRAISTVVLQANEPVTTTDRQYDESISAVHQGMIMVDRTVLKSLIEDVKRQGADLNVAVYEYDKKMEVWNRAEKWCQ